MTGILVCNASFLSEQKRGRRMLPPSFEAFYSMSETRTAGLAAD
jgi:hypothetical protein